MPEMTDEQKVGTLAEWSSRFKAGVREMVEAGHDPDELDASIAGAEEKYEKDQAELRKKMKTRKSLRRF